MPKGQCHCGAVRYEMSDQTIHTNEQAFPGQIDVQIATLDDPDAIVPQAQIQIAERIGWMERLDSMPKFERYPGM